MARGKECGVHTHDSTIPQEKHHIWPLGYHGPNVKSNLVLVCCNGHSDIHYYMDYMLKHNGATPPDWNTYGTNVRHYARRGYSDVIAYAESLAATMEV